jgi:hypothetical protein
LEKAADGLVLQITEQISRNIAKKAYNLIGALYSTEYTRPRKKQIFVLQNSPRFSKQAFVFFFFFTGMVVVANRLTRCPQAKKKPGSQNVVHETT